MKASLYITTVLLLSLTATIITPIINAQDISPDWMFIYIIYIVLYVSKNWGIALIVKIGVILDILNANPLGINSSSLSIIFLILIIFENKIKKFGIFKSSVMIALLTIINKGIIFSRLFSTKIYIYEINNGVIFSNILIWVTILALIRKSKKI